MDPLETIRAFDQFGAPTVETIRDSIPYLVNQFWTSGQRQAHSIHEISYRACFKAQLPEFFIDLLTEPGQSVHDPFAGRGTTPIQAGLMGRRSSANDVNPLSAMLIAPRMAPIPSLREIERRLLMIPITAHVDHPELSVFYHPDTLMRIAALRLWFRERGVAGTLDHVDAWIRMVTLNRLTGHSSGFLSVYTLPPNQAVSIASQKKINTTRQQIPPYRDLTNIVLKKTKTLLKDGAPNIINTPLLTTGDAWNTPQISTSSVDLVVTSPPFLDIVQYSTDNWLRGWFADIDPGSVQFSQLKTEHEWQDMMRTVLVEQARIVRPGGYVAVEVGEVRGGKVLLEQLVWQAVEGLPFERLGVIVNQADFTKTANIWKIDNNTKGTNTNRIVLLRRIQ